MRDKCYIHIFCFVLYLSLGIFNIEFCMAISWSNVSKKKQLKYPQDVPHTKHTTPKESHTEGRKTPFFYPDKPF